MDNLIKKLVEEFEKQEKKVEKISEKANKESKIVAKVNKKGCVEVLGVNGTQTALISLICLILHEMERHSDDTAEHMAMVVLNTLEMEKKIND